MPRLTLQEQQEVIRFIEADKPLPEKYRFLLFGDKREVELVWNGKTGDVTNVVLPFQTIEHVDEPRAEKPEDLAQQSNLFDTRGRQLSGWTNKLIWGDNKLILSSLKNGPLRKQIEDAGGLKLIYIDPPFDVGADFSMDIEIGEDTFTKKPSIIEEIAYRDTWGKGPESFVAMIYERLIQMRDLMATDGSIYLHCDWRLNSFIRVIMDEVFGDKNFKAEIKWKRVVSTGSSKAISRKWPVVDDSILFYTKSDAYTWNQIYAEFSEDYLKRYTLEDGRGKFYWDNLGTYSEDTLKRLISEDRIKLPLQKGKNPRYKNYLHERKGVVADNLWTDINPVNSQANQSLMYPTQKPEGLFERIVKASSNPGDLIADFFCGSGTTCAVAEMQGRKWIASDLGKFAVHTTRKRLIGVQRQLKDAGQDYRAFEILNLGKYERQHYVGVNPNLREAEQAEQLAAKEAAFLDLILKAYQAEKVLGFATFHGKKAGRLVAVGPINMPVTRLFIDEIVLECRKKQITKVDVLGFEFEMGLFPNVLDEAKSKGIDISPKQIPREVFDKRAVEKNQVVFHDVAYIEVKPHVTRTGLAVELIDFSVFYSQESVKQAEESLKEKASKIVVENGKIVKVSKDAKGIVTKEILTKTWSDWIDYWAVDFNFESKREIIRIQDEESGEWEELWTGDYVFENEWQSFRTRKERSLEFKSVFHECLPGRRKIAVKVVDIFGNDTMTIVEVNIPGKK